MKNNRIERLWAAHAKRYGIEHFTKGYLACLRAAFAAGAADALREAEAHGDGVDVPAEWIKRFAGEADEMLRKEATA